MRLKHAITTVWCEFRQSRSWRAKCDWKFLNKTSLGDVARTASHDIGAICIGYRLRWRSDIWRTDRGVAEVRSPGVRPATEDDIRHNAPGLLETVHQLLRTKVRRQLLNQDKPSRLAIYALQQHNLNLQVWQLQSFLFSLPFWERSWWARAVEQACEENFETSASQVTEELGRERTARVTTMTWSLTLLCSKPDSWYW